MTESRSGETCRPWNSSSSAVFTTTTTSAGGTTRTSPARNRAAPTPPASATSTLRRLCQRRRRLDDRAVRLKRRSRPSRARAPRRAPSPARPARAARRAAPAPGRRRARPACRARRASSWALIDRVAHLRLGLRLGRPRLRPRPWPARRGSGRVDARPTAFGRAGCAQLAAADLGLLEAHDAEADGDVAGVGEGLADVGRGHAATPWRRVLGAGGRPGGAAPELASEC